MDIKILIDKSVLLASSVRASIEEIDNNIEHRFYTISARLMNKLEENRGLGYITNEIEKDTQELLSKAVLDTIRENDESIDINEMEHLYTLSSICNQKLNDRISICNKVGIKTEDYKKYLETIRNFSLDLLKFFNERFSETPSEKTKDMLKRTSMWLNGNTVRAIKSSNKDPTYPVLHRKIIREPIEKEDQILLSQAVHLNQDRFKDHTLLITSCDQHFVGVRRAKDSSNSDLIPSKIKERLDIECMWPDALSKKYLEDN